MNRLTAHKTTRAPRSIARTLLTSVLTVYFLLTLVITTGQITFEYNNTRDALLDDLRNQHHTFAASFSRAMWEFNHEQTDALAEGLMNIPAINGIILRDDQERILINRGATIASDRLQTIEHSGPIPEVAGIFGYHSPLVFEFAGGTEIVGDVFLFSSRDVTIERLRPSIILLVLGALIKSSLLILLFTLAFRYFLRSPFENLIEQLRNFSPERPEASHIRLEQPEVNEFSLLEDAYNDLLSRLRSHQNDLDAAHANLNAANRRLEDQNLLFEQEIAEKTIGISKLMLDLERRRHDLEIRQHSLEQEVHQRRLTESRLKQANRDLEESLTFLQQARNQLLASEKLASLGSLVTNIAHDVSTPLGVGVTAASYLKEKFQHLQHEVSENKMTSEGLLERLSALEEAVELIDVNLQRANELMDGFKQVAADQASEAVREVNVKQYVQRIIKALKPQLQKQACEVTLTCPETIVAEFTAGALAQILTNMMVNSLIHGFEQKPNGKINISVRVDGQHLHFHYCDNGVGMSQRQLRQLFDAFYTTQRNQGGSGLGTHIIHSLITQSLHGKITASSKPGQGLCYDFSFPVTLQQPVSEMSSQN